MKIFQCTVGGETSSEWAKRPEGKTSWGRNVQGRNVQWRGDERPGPKRQRGETSINRPRAKHPGGETSRWRNVQGWNVLETKRPRNVQGAKRPGGETSRGAKRPVKERNVQGAKRQRGETSCYPFGKPMSYDTSWELISRQIDDQVSVIKVHIIMMWVLCDNDLMLRSLFGSICPVNCCLSTGYRTPRIDNSINEMQFT